jgi:hypothetical protein
MQLLNTACLRHPQGQQHSRIFNQGTLQRGDDD